MSSHSIPWKPLFLVIFQRQFSSAERIAILSFARDYSHFLHSQMNALLLRYAIIKFRFSCGFEQDNILIFVGFCPICAILTVFSVVDVKSTGTRIVLILYDVLVLILPGLWSFFYQKAELLMISSS